MAQQRGYQIVEEFTDRISGAKARRLGLEALMRDARRGQLQVVLTWASDPVSRRCHTWLPGRLGRLALALSLAETLGENALYLDLELTSDGAKLSDPEFHLNSPEGRLVTRDEIHRLWASSRRFAASLIGVLDDLRCRSQSSQIRS